MVSALPAGCETLAQAAEVMPGVLCSTIHTATSVCNPKVTNVAEP